MFGLFGDKSLEPSVTPEDKEWIERNFIWFLEVFGMERLKNKPFLLPISEDFPYNNLLDNSQFCKLFEQLCAIWELDSGNISIKVFDDEDSSQWMTWKPDGSKELPGKKSGLDKKPLYVKIAKSNFDNSEILVSAIVFELATIKLKNGNYFREQDKNFEHLKDLISIFFGFGIFIANSTQTLDVYWVNRVEFLPNQIIGYSSALICYVTGKSIDKYCNYLNLNVKKYLRNDHEYLIESNDTYLTKTQLEISGNIHRLIKRMESGFNRKDYADAILAANELLKLKQDDEYVYTNLGYALMKQENYQDAIKQFSNAIKLNIHFDAHFNDRGYCKIQLGDLEGAYSDIQSALEQNHKNPLVLRNMGICYMEMEDSPSALEYFDKAVKIDPQTELINLYLSKIHLKLGNVEKSEMYLKKSIELKECNDSDND